MSEGAIVGLRDEGTVVLVTIEDDEGRTHSYGAHPRMLVVALSNMFPDQVFLGQRITYEAESWGGLASIGPSQEG